MTNLVTNIIIFVITFMIFGLKKIFKKYIFTIRQHIHGLTKLIHVSS